MSHYSNQAQAEHMAAELQAMADLIKARPLLFPQTPHKPEFAMQAPVSDTSYGMSCGLCGGKREDYFATLCKRCAGATKV